MVRLAVVILLAECCARWGLVDGDEIGLPIGKTALEVAEVEVDEAVVRGEAVVIESGDAVRYEYVCAAGVVTRLDEHGVEAGSREAPEKCVCKNVAGA